MISFREALCALYPACIVRTVSSLVGNVSIQYSNSSRVSTNSNTILLIYV